VNSVLVSIDFQVTCRVDYSYRFSEEPTAASMVANKDVDCGGGSYVCHGAMARDHGRAASVCRAWGSGPLCHLPL